MEFEIPQALRLEHDGLHARLSAATREAGEVGERAREVARLLHPHFVREEEFALPPLGLLGALSKGEVTPEMARVLTLTRRLKAELPHMLQEHAQIVGALEEMRSAARTSGLAHYERFAHDLIQHAQTEEQVLYPAALLVGELVERSVEVAPG